MKLLRTLYIIVILTVFFASNLYGQDKPQYVGASKCRVCHKSAKRGDQFTKWQEGPHAKAYASLASEAAKKAAADAGIKGDPQKAGQCLECHVTAYKVDAALKADSYSIEEGVSCETCHGPGSLYRKASVMNAKKYAADPAAAVAEWEKLGLIHPDEKLCVSCHNEKSPTYKPFNFEEFSKMIAHPNPNIKK